MGDGLDGTSEPHLLATKIGAWQAYNHTVEDCLAEVRDNLRVLRRDRVDVLLGHDMERARFWKPDAEDTALDTGEPLDYESAPVVQAMRAARTHGWCRYLGLSSNLSQPLAHVLQRIELDKIVGAAPEAPYRRGAKGRPGSWTDAESRDGSPANLGGPVTARRETAGYRESRRTKTPGPAPSLHGVGSARCEHEDASDLRTRSRRGKSVVRRITAKSRFARAVRAVHGWCKRNRHLPIKQQQEHLSLSGSSGATVATTV